MADIFDSEPSEASDLSEENVNSKAALKKRSGISSSDSSDSEEEDIPNEEEICRKEGEGWLVDEAEEEDEGEESESSSNGSDADSKEREDNKDEDDDDLLDEDDYDLIEENVGKKRKHRLVVDDDEDDEEEGPSRLSKKVRRTDDESRTREAIAQELFKEYSDEEGTGARRRRGGDVSDRHVGVVGKDVGSAKALNLEVGDDEDEEEDEEDDLGDFIVDDRRTDALRRPQKKNLLHKDAALQQAQDIFGVDFDPEEFERFRRGEDQDFDDEAYEEDFEEDEKSAKRKGKARAGRVNLRQRKGSVDEQRVYELFDPSDLERAFYGQIDERIRKTDIPERFQLRRVPLRHIDPGSPSYSTNLRELVDEADWIYKSTFKSEPDNKPPSAIPKIHKALQLMRENLYEVPFIAFYRKECVERELTIADLWRIYEWDERWEILQRHKRGMTGLLQRLVDYFETVANSPAPVVIECAEESFSEAEPVLLADYDLDDNHETTSLEKDDNNLKPENSIDLEIVKEAKQTEFANKHASWVLRKRCWDETRTAKVEKQRRSVEIHIEAAALAKRHISSLLKLISL
ncbi:unnamed protein product [Protopolystoma xenopodis]|uniref:Spt6 acidic N-terminal domain-containing protein n=1 Tax=Protopolystoma xenopodis TaxID=117903 RepID=A0A448XJL5_9PLAT|nr:unnamed protein product [Protopolystoma xenopodis]